MAKLYRLSAVCLIIVLIAYSAAGYAEKNQQVWPDLKVLSLESIASEHEVKAIVHYGGNGNPALDRYLRERAEAIAKSHLVPLNQALEGFSIPKFIEKSYIAGLNAQHIRVEASNSGAFDSATLGSSTALTLRPGQTLLKLWTRFIISVDYSQLQLSTSMTLVHNGAANQNAILHSNDYYYESDTIDPEKRAEGMALFKKIQQAENWYESERQKIDAIKIKGRRYSALKKLNKKYREERKSFQRHVLINDPLPEFISIWADKAGNTFKDKLEKV